MNQVSWPDKGLGVLHLWPMRAEGTCPLMPWMILLPGKPKRLALQVSWPWTKMLYPRKRSPTPREKARRGLEWHQWAGCYTCTLKSLCPGMPTCNGGWLGGCQYRPALIPLRQSHAPPGGHTCQLQSYTRQPLCSSKGQGLGQWSGWLLGQMACYYCHASG